MIYLCRTKFFVIGVLSEDEDLNIIIYTTIRQYNAKLTFRYLVNIVTYSCVAVYDERSV